MEKQVLVTGATGLIGSYLLRDLTLAGHAPCVVVRPSRSESAVARVEQIMQFWDERCGRRLPRPRVLTGEVTTTGLGLTAEDRAWVARHCDRVLHNAAILDFYGPDRT